MTNCCSLGVYHDIKGSSFMSETFSQLKHSTSWKELIRKPKNMNDQFNKDVKKQKKPIPKSPGLRKHPMKPVWFLIHVLVKSRSGPGLFKDLFLSHPSLIQFSSGIFQFNVMFFRLDSALIKVWSWSCLVLFSFILVWSSSENDLFQAWFCSYPGLVLILS